MEFHVSFFGRLASLIKSVLLSAVTGVAAAWVLGWMLVQPDVKHEFARNGFPLVGAVIEREQGHWETIYAHWVPSLVAQYEAWPEYCKNGTEVNDLQRERCAQTKKELLVQLAIVLVPPILMLWAFFHVLGAAGAWAWRASRSFEKARLVGNLRVERVVKVRRKLPNLYTWIRGLRRRELKLQNGHKVQVYVHPSAPRPRSSAEVMIFALNAKRPTDGELVACLHQPHVHVSRARR